MTGRLFAREDDPILGLHADDEPTKRQNSRKTRKPPQMIGECHPGDEVLISAQVTMFVNGQAYVRFATSHGWQSEPIAVPALVSIEKPVRLR